MYVENMKQILPQLVADEITQDADFQEIKSRFFSLLDRHKRKISQIQPSNSAKKTSYKEALETLVSLRGTGSVYPYLGTGMGNGPFVELADGSVKFDCICGIGVHFSHHHPRVVEARFDAMVESMTMQGNLMPNQIHLELSELLTRYSGMDHAFFTSSGAMACENALKLAFQKKAPRNRVFAFTNSFSGRTISMAQVSDKPAQRDGIPLEMHVDYIPFYDEMRPEESLKEAIHTLESLLKRYPKQHAAMFFEMIQGEGGYWPGSQPFFKALMQRLKEEEIAVIVDEVQTFGRTDHLFAFQHFGLDSFVDIVTVGKLFQCCATCFRKEYKPRPRLIAQTFTSSASAMYAGKAILSELVEGGYLGKEGKNQTLGDQFRNGLRRLATLHPDKVHGPFGYGLMAAITIGNGTHEEASLFLHDLFERGAIAFMGGGNPIRVRFHLPIGDVTSEQIDLLLGLLEKSLDAL